ncbi:hypothetical protein BRC64_10585 [Halobacteriales archaeon QH_10_67_22]|nr:MAG: hypothetical protein BRC64_10585 [Halobacteriales archaeon QH_10_67_22]
MGRRAFLRWLALAGTAGFAGCEALPGGSENDAEYESTAGDHLAVAVGNLNTVAFAVGEYQRAGPRETTFDPERPRERLATAQEAIDAAADASESEDRRKDVAAVRGFADGVEGTVDSVVGLDEAGTRLDAVRAILEAEEVDTDEASAVLEAATAASSAATAAHRAGTDALESADGARLRSLDAQYGPVRSGLRTLAGYVAGVDALALGYSDQVAGVGHLQSAEDAVDGEQYDAAGESFAAAREAFEAAAATFEGSKDDAAEDLVADLDLGDKRGQSLASLSAGYVSLLAAREALTAAETAIDDDAYDEARTQLEAGSDATATASDRFEAGDGLVEGEFTDEFDQARARTTAVASLSEGYLGLLDARDHVTEADSLIDEERYDAARAVLEDASADSTAADERFAAGEDADADLVTEKFETARTRAAALDSLSTGYGTLLDARDDLDRAGSAFSDDDYGSAETAAESAAETSRSAGETFAAGRETTGETFAAEFETASNRATAIEALAGGYSTMVGARREAEKGRDDLDSGFYEAADDHFETAAGRLDDAEATMREGRAAVDGKFDTEFGRALCQVTTLGSAVDHFEAAAEAGRDGRLGAADRARDDGETELERVEDC